MFEGGDESHLDQIDRAKQEGRFLDALIMQCEHSASVAMIRLLTSGFTLRELKQAPQPVSVEQVWRVADAELTAAGKSATEDQRADVDILWRLNEVMRYLNLVSVENEEAASVIFHLALHAGRLMASTPSAPRYSPANDAGANIHVSGGKASGEARRWWYDVAAARCAAKRMEKPNITTADLSRLLRREMERHYPPEVVKAQGKKALPITDGGYSDAIRTLESEGKVPRADG